MAEDGPKQESKGSGTNRSGNFDSNGKFAKGNRAGEGHSTPSHTATQDFKKWFQGAVSKQDISDIATAMVTKARAGDAKAAQLVLDRCMGKPEQPVNVGGVDGGPLPPITIILKKAD